MASPANSGAQEPCMANFQAMSRVVINLGPTCTTYRAVQQAFLLRLLKMDNGAHITNVQWLRHSYAKLMAYRATPQSTTAMRGGANIWYGCHGMDMASIRRICLEGFGEDDTQRKVGGYGIGLHLWDYGFPHKSAMDSEKDINREHYVLLCRVILGNMEQIERRTQSGATSRDYDSGVKNLSNPTCYVVWSTNMNTHVLPEYIICYRISEALQD